LFLNYKNMSLADKASLLLIPTGYKSQKVYSIFPTDGVGDFDFSRSSSATRIAKNGLITSVASNVPRLEYPLIDGVVSGCPSLLLEPQSTNIVTYSQSLTESIYNTSNAVILDNNVTSPDGTLNASSITDSNGGGTNVTQIFLPSLSVDTSSQYTYSIFAKKKGLNYISLRVEQFTTPATSDCFFDLENGSIVSVAAGYDSAKIENYGNGWYRCSVTFTTDAVDASGNLVVRLSEDGISTGSIPQDGTSSVYLWGWSCEKKSYPTSYIPTNGAAVTRSAETANGSGDATTFNDSEGVLMAEISALADDGSSNKRISISDGTNTNRIVMFFNANINTYAISSNGAGSVITNSTNPVQNNKITISYSGTSVKTYINGFQIDSSTFGGFNSNTLDVLSFANGNLTEPFYGNTKQVQYYNSALTDSELETLTSWVSFTEMAQAQQYSII
jgi:hypothetical protein